MLALRWRTIAVVVWALGFAGAGLAQTQSDKPGSGETVLKTTTRLVVVDVVAADAKGQAVSGLRPEDFKIFENGKPQEIRIFDFQHPTQPSEHPAVAPAKLPANVVTNAPVYKANSAMNIVLLDMLNTAVPRQTYARDELFRFLEKLPATGPVAIYVLAGGLHLVQDFTDDPQVLLAAVRRLQSKSSALMDNPTGGPAMVVPLPNDPMFAAIEGRVRVSEQQARTFTEEEQVDATLAALNSLARRLAPSSGRKNLIWISDGFPFYVNPHSASQRYVHTTSLLSASKADTVLMDSQVAIYPLDAHALKVTGFYDVGFGKVNGANGGNPLPSMSKDFNERSAIHSTMNDLAEETGGEAFYNTNNIEQSLRQSLHDGSTYYTLGYYPRDKRWDGKFRRIEVKLNRPGVKLRYRIGYYAIEPAGPQQKNGTWAINLHEAMDLNSPLSSALLFQAAVVAPSEKTGNKVVIDFGIEPHAIQFEKDDKGLEHAALECAVEAYSREGKLANSDATNVNAALSADVYAHISQSFFPCRQTLSLPPGDYWLRLGVVDSRTGLIGTANARVTVPVAGPQPSAQ